MEPITSARRQEIHALAVQLIVFASSVFESVKGGINFGSTFGLAQSFLTIAPVFAAVADFTDEERVVFGAELLDAATGTDPSALAFTVDFLPGLDPSEEEELFDSMKQLLEGVFAKRIAAGGV